MYVHGRRATWVRRRRLTAAGLVLLLLLACGAGWYLWGPHTATVQGTGGHAGTTAEPTMAAREAPTTGLDPELKRRFTAARATATAEGVDLTLTSGWRSAAEQQALVDQAITRYGTVEKAQAWVLPPETSEHVKGMAIDVGPAAGALWLGKHARTVGLCRTYANEVWHFEKLAKGAKSCPKLHPDASWGW
jgi:D-alanyl-D-alanine carboxypeptidase